MNKKGFTLIELTISIALLSLIMAFLFNFLITIRKNEDGVKDDTEMVILRNTIAKYINEDIRKKRVTNISCCSGYNCTYTCSATTDNVAISLGDDMVKKISLIKNSDGVYDTIQYENITDTSNVIVEFRKKLPDKYLFEPIEINQYHQFFYITLPIQLHQEFNIDIVGSYIQ